MGWSSNTGLWQFSDIGIGYLWVGSLRCNQIEVNVSEPYVSTKHPEL